MRLRWTVVAAWLGAGVVVAASCGGDDVEPEGLCDPGVEVFCRCRGTLEAGTKTCNATGDGFGPCDNGVGQCEEVEATSGGGGAGAGSSVGGSPDPGELYAPCDLEAGASCNSGLECDQGYCTKICTDYTECQPLGDCVVGEGAATCAPYCVQQTDCELFGSASSCGYTDETLPPFDVVVCKNHGDALDLPPPGYPCDGDAQCNLGFQGTEWVCDAMECADGCHVDEDCGDQEATCSTSDGTLGSCGGGSGENIDECPGLGVTLSAATPNVLLSGDTSLAPLPSEANGTGLCDSLEATEEDVYHLTVQDAGDVIVLVETSDASHDPIVYVRSGSCDGGTQLACADDANAGAGEILGFTAGAGEDVWVFVDGFGGSVGPYTIELDLTVP